MEKKQNSVEWLIRIVQSCIAPNYIPQEIIKQAKAMHKEEVEDAWINGMKEQLIAPFGMNRYKPEAEQYYNETFGGENETH